VENKSGKKRGKKETFADGLLRITLPLSQLTRKGTDSHSSSSDPRRQTEKEGEKRDDTPEIKGLEGRILKKKKTNSGKKRISKKTVTTD